MEERMEEPQAVSLPGMERLAGIMRRLLDPGGCPWDRAQDARSLKTFLVEETYELVEAIDRGQAGAIREELGDVLLQVVFQAELARRRGDFDLEDVAQTIATKLIRRHPHVFGTRKASNPDEAIASWESVKRQEHEDPERSTLDGVPAQLPALLAALRLGEKAGAVGFDWPAPEPVWEKVHEELGELAEAVGSGEREAIRHEIGDLLFAVCNLARKLEVDPEDALRLTNRRFRSRFAHVERRLLERGQTASEVGLAELDRLWEEAKRSGPEAPAAG
jgi:MazG family protein